MRCSIPFLVLLAITDSCTSVQAGTLCREGRGAGVSIACLGDSNTQSDWQIGREDGFPSEDGWCERLSSRFETTNCGLGGASASPNTLPYGWDLEDQLSEAPQSDFTVMAFVTNDAGYAVDGPNLLLVAPDPWSVAMALAAYADDPAVLIATGPHRYDDAAKEAFVQDTNAALRLLVPASQLLDFTSGFGLGDYLDDGLHMNSLGMEKRARIVRQRLIAIPEPPYSLEAAASIFFLSPLSIGSWRVFRGQGRGAT